MRLHSVTATLTEIAQLTMTAQHDPPPSPGRDAAERIVDDRPRRRGWKNLDQHPARRPVVLGPELRNTTPGPGPLRTRWPWSTPRRPRLTRVRPIR
ncbi:hypothetical protein ACTMTI_41335 [Nonomuraea sp. H19]|uniref:hypothetical protein n=1 Tax=Nonomuraea sp. H19 TaxID=3452206 RepID=UPI003F8A7722